MYDKENVRQYLRENEIIQLFNYLGWEYENEEEYIEYEIKGKKKEIILNQIADKKGFAIYLYDSEINGEIPDKPERDKIQSKVIPLKRENIIVYLDRDNNSQIWQTTIKEKNEPIRRREIKFIKNQREEELLRILENQYSDFEEQDELTITTVTGRVKKSFDVEKVTKRFYDYFKKEHTQFFDFIEGISDESHREWYTSVMLNRIMFIYFIQKKGFLNNETDYLRKKLSYIKANEGENEFYGFYLDFLKVLFKDGLNKPENLRDSKTIELIGDIPYLNGGMFAEHFIEEKYKQIKIPDEAFEKVFDFFDKYQWTLDTRESRDEKEVNPDVIGYIFEKYINQKQMGAYYTKEDITEYISKNTIVPFIFEKAQNIYPQGFNDSSYIWYMLKESGDRYIYDSVRKGVNGAKDIYEVLTKDIADGIKDVSKRSDWNSKTPEKFALPTEIWRETIERMQRYFEIKAKIAAGEIKSINDFITYNLDIRQFMQDIIENCDDGELLRAIYFTIAGRKAKKSNEKDKTAISILDPTCGSGAFLFAALNILEPLYEACLDKMEEFITDTKYKDFKDILDDMNTHINKPYFIYKSIILNNLYGVDIMNEAIEIAKLRLFLKLVSLVEKKENLEPLPDIDFNIKAGNTLVGFASSKEVKELFANRIVDEVTPIIKEKCKLVSLEFHRFREHQSELKCDMKNLRDSKNTVNQKLIELNNELNDIMARNYYGNKVTDGSKFVKDKFEEWKKTHQPFHWFAEFYEIIEENGGFDVIIGNPPYLVYTENKFEYSLKNYKTHNCQNLYAFCCERAYNIVSDKGKFGMIIPNSSISADKMIPLQELFMKNNSVWVSNFSWRPSKLFEGADMLLAIVITTKTKINDVFSTKYNKWYSDYREVLFQNLTYSDIRKISMEGSLSKKPSFLFTDIFEKMKKKSEMKKITSYFLQNANENKVLYFRAVQYWIKILASEPVFIEDGNQTSTGEMKYIYTASEEERYIVISVLSSSLFFIFYITYASCQVINSRDLEMYLKIENIKEEHRNKIIELGKKLQNDYVKNSKIIKRNYAKKGREFIMEKQHFYIKKSKSIIDEIDKVLAEHYGFTNEELDFIINYDIKYRMGKDSEEDEE